MSLSGASKLNISRNAPTTLTLMLSPDVIIFGGGVMKQRHMVEKGSSSF